ncbi:MAG: nucleoid-associated protein [Bacteroidales bacterium]|nr:nucleoid-associated protein [Bacteroidales bacterium]
MPVFDASSIHTVALHRVGNKATDEGYVLSNAPLQLTEQLQDILVRYFLTPFKVEEYYNLFDESHVEMNLIYQRCANIFADPDCLMEESKLIAQQLYDASTHANIKGGELMVVYFSQCMLNGETMDAVGIFKSENKESFLKVQHDQEQWSRQEGDMSAQAEYRLEVHQGINPAKLDKGAIIFNTDMEKGYVVNVVDATNRSTDAVYWKDTFLGLRQREDEYYNTHTEMQAYKKFVTDELPQQFEGVSKADQADMLNRCSNYFKQNDNFDLQSFAEEVIAQPEVIDSFQQYRQQYQEENDIQMPDSYDISESAVKKQSRAYKSVIKLDKNFHIYVHGDRQLIEQGEDEKGKFYKVYFNEES